jgi:hypothetical protein
MAKRLPEQANIAEDLQVAKIFYQGFFSLTGFLGL